MTDSNDGKAERQEPVVTRGVESIADTLDILTTEAVEDTGDIYTTEDMEDSERSTRPRRRGAVRPGPPEDEEVNPVGSYESWDQTGQSLDAAGAGMTGDSGSVGLTGTGFEDDTEIKKPK